jgi:uncharacterized protein (DUF433 family)
MLDRIQVDPGVCEGHATIRGLRITVEFVLKLPRSVSSSRTRWS